MKKQPSDVVMQSDIIDLYRKALKQGVKISQVEKKINHYLKRMNASEEIETKEDILRSDNQKKVIPKIVRAGAFLLPILFLIIGFYLVGSAVLPIIGSYIIVAKDVQLTNLTSPIPNEQVMDVTPLVITQTEDFEKSERELRIINEELDYTNLSNWFTSSALPQMGLPEVDYNIESYTIDIPEVDISNAVVAVGGTDLNSSLIAFKGTALPGNPGSPVIFGHSVLRQFYNPSEKNPRRYNSIFSTIMTLDIGDKIYVTSGGVKYTYAVSLKKEVNPEDVYILTQKYDAKQLKLVTCTPEGTYLRRGVVTAQLIE
ncbi:sortase [Candidatus Woesebacteria bacterium]|nr:sortase [Candidatus Woesebacteria bacterium]